VRGLVVLLLAATAPEAVRERVMPSKAELAWQSLHWRPSLWDGVVEAHRARKPVLLWAMNGHPLGLT